MVSYSQQGEEVVCTLGFAANLCPFLLSSSGERASEGFKGKTEPQNLNTLMPSSF